MKTAFGTLALLALASTGAAQARDLRETIVAACSDESWAEPIAWLRQYRPPAADLVDALVGVAGLSREQTRQCASRLLDNLADFDADLVALWRKEPDERAARAAVFLALGPRRLARLWAQGDARDRADLERTMALGTAVDCGALREVVGEARNSALVRPVEALARAMVAAPHPVDAFDLTLLAKTDADPALLAKQVALREALQPHLRDPRAWARFATLLDHADPRVRARGSFLIRQGVSRQPPLGVLAAWATDPWVPWQQVDLDFDDATVRRALAPALALRGAAGLHHVLVKHDGPLPPLSVPARDALGDALIALLLARGEPLPAPRREVVGHFVGDAAHQTRVQAARLLGQLGLGACAMQEARRAARTEVQLAVLAPECLPALAGAVQVDDLRALWAEGNAAVRAGIADLLSHRSEVPQDLADLTEATAFDLVHSGLGRLSCVPLPGIGSDDAAIGLPSTAAARLVLAACTMGHRSLLLALTGAFKNLTNHGPTHDRCDGHTVFVLHALGELGPWLDAPQATGLFDQLERRLRALDASAAGAFTVPVQELLLDPIAGLVASLPDARRERLQQLLATPQYGATLVARVRASGPSVRRARAMWLLEHWPQGRPWAPSVLRAAPEWLASAWRAGDPDRKHACEALQRFCTSAPSLVASWHAAGILPQDLLAAALATLPTPSPDLLGCIAKTTQNASWTPSWLDVVRDLDPARARPLLERFVQSPDPRFAAAAAAALVRGDASAKARGLEVLQRLATSPQEDVRIEALRQCAAGGILTPVLLEEARQSRSASGFPRLLGFALLRRVGEFDDLQLRQLGASVAIHVLQLADSWIAPDQLLALDPNLVTSSQWWPNLPPLLKAAVLTAAAGQAHPTFLLMDVAIRKTSSPDPRLRRAAYQLLHSADRAVFPQAALVGETVLDDASGVRAVPMK